MKAVTKERVRRVDKQASTGWDISDKLKRTIEREARALKLPAATLVESAVREYIARRHAEDEAEQERLRALIEPFIGCVSSDPGAPSETVSETVRRRLDERYPLRKRTD
jgi:hypothetical protein